jgi:hypothetical protein
LISTVPVVPKSGLVPPAQLKLSTAYVAFNPALS